MKQRLLFIAAVFCMLNVHAFTVTMTAMNVTCYGGCNGSLTANPSGGTAPYSYSWAPSVATTQTITGLCVGVYTVTVTDATMATATQTYAITSPTALTGTISVTPVTIFNACNGSALFTASGGTGAYSYNWSPAPGSGQGTANPGGLCAGTYTCTITDSNACTFTGSTVVTQPLAMTITPSITNVSCNAMCDGAASVNVTGGTPPYTYSWSNGPTTSSVSNLCAGVYMCTVTDANSATATANITITQPTPVTVSVTASPSVICAGSTVTLSCTGATTYIWMPGNLAGSPVYVTPTVTTTYTCTGTNANGCTGTTVVTIIVNQPPVVSFSSSTNVSCFGGSDGSITCTPSGGNPPYTYIWTPQSSTAQTMTNLIAGTYTCTVTDANGCIGANAVQVTEPPQLVATITNITPSGCNLCDGSATVSGTGGTGVYTYNWLPNGNTATIQALCAGSYTAEITDANGCIASAPALVGDSCDYVWPGDANDDAVADNIDILDIGVANGATGTTRANASLNWIGQPSAAWGQTLASGTDYKWVDCNGDGAINPADTNAVVQNFGLTHNNRYSANPPYNASLPDLTVTMGQQQLPANSAGTLTISLGNSSVAAANVYGVAFTLNFDPAQIDATSFRMNENGSWMGTAGNDLMGVTLMPGANAGSVQVALVRLDHNDMSGSGLIANMGFMTTNALYASGTSQNVNFTISNITIISSNEMPQQVNAVGDSVNVIDPLILNVNESAAANSISVYPNPFSESTQIVLPESCNGKNCELTLTDATGRVVLVQQTNGSGAITLQRGTLEAGVYFCTLRSEGVLLTTEKLLIR